jgi:hypothetical protein
VGSGVQGKEGDTRARAGCITAMGPGADAHMGKPPTKQHNSSCAHGIEAGCGRCVSVWMAHNTNNKQHMSAYPCGRCHDAGPGPACARGGWSWGGGRGTGRPRAGEQGAKHKVLHHWELGQHLRNGMHVHAQRGWACKGASIIVHAGWCVCGGGGVKSTATSQSGIGAGKSCECRLR